MPILKKALNSPIAPNISAKMAFILNWLTVGACGAVAIVQFVKDDDYDFILPFIIDSLIFARIQNVLQNNIINI